VTVIIGAVVGGIAAVLLLGCTGFLLYSRSARRAALKVSPATS
jgi:hypothetical protein